MDAHNLLFERLTSIMFHNLNVEELEGFQSVNADETCSICKRNIKEQPSRFKSIAYVGSNSYKETVTYCICCSAFFQNNTEVLGVEKPKAPNTSNKFGMLTGGGAFIEQNSNRTILFLPAKIIEKIPSSTINELFPKYGIKLIEDTQFNQITHLAQLSDIKFPAVWVNNFGRKTTALGLNITFSHSEESLIQVNDDELNSSLEALYTINLKKLAEFSSAIADIKKSDFNKFKKIISDLSNGRVSPLEVSEFLKKNEEFIPLMPLLPRDPHQRIQTLALAEKIK